MSLVSFMSESMSAESLTFNPLANIVRNIIADANGAMLDPSDMTTMYQDAAGTTTVTAVEQPVGLILDKSGNGNHATQSVTASRPTLSARYNLLTKTEDFSYAVWTKSNINITSGHASPYGNIASKIIPTTTSSVHRLLQEVTTGTGTKIFVFAIKAAGYTTVNLQVTDNVSGDFRADIDLLTGNVTGFIKASVWVSGSITTKILGDGWILVTVTGVNNTNPLTVPIINIKDRSSYAGDGVSGILLCIPDLRLGSTVGQYQRVNTSTDYDTDERYFPKYLRFDGVDDYLNLPYMGLYAGGSASIITGRDALSQATDTYIISERSTASTSPKYFPSRQLASGGNMDSYITNDAGTVVLDTTGSVFGGASNAVIRSVIDAGNSIKLLKNGAVAASDNYERGGTLTLNTTAIGASVSTTTSNYAKMKLYVLLIAKSALSDAQRIQCERYAASKAGVIL